VAHAAGAGDLFAADARGGIGVPPANSQYRVQYVSLPDDEFRGYYYGFANEGLWPLCHRVNVTPVFRRADYEMYRAANTRFATMAANEATGPSPTVLVQDYHFALAPAILRRRVPHARIVTFWHIPWPRPRTFMQCPWACDLLESLIASDIVGLQTDDDCINFLSCVEAVLPASVDVGERRIRYRGYDTAIRAYPVGVDCTNEALRSAPPTSVCSRSVRRELGLSAGTKLGIGVDRMDYTKGITEKFLAIEALLENEPERVGHFVFVQIAEPSRDCLGAYRTAREQAFNSCQRINQRFGTADWAPIRFLEQHHEPSEVYRYYRAADFCFVASLHDGMNLVAKEFVAARGDDTGVLILSQFAGAAQQLRSAILVNPSNVRQSAAAMSRALNMHPVEQAARMRLMRRSVTTFDARWWAKQMVQDAAMTKSAIPAQSEWTEAVA
jgi:trehalose 6-phosphate synthase